MSCPLITELASDFDAIKTKVASYLTSPAAQQVEAVLTTDLEAALDSYIIAELARLGVATAGLTTSTLPTLLGTLGSTLIAALASKLTAKITTPAAAPTTPAK